MADAHEQQGTSTLAAGTVLAEKFSIVRMLGRGGMGTVYEGLQLSLRRRVAIKTLNPELSRNRDVRARFLREGELAARIRHPNVIEVIDTGEHGGMPFLVLEFLEGEDLGQRLGRLGRLGATEAIDLLLPVCGAIATAHDKGVIHRDLKPENIFLQTSARGSAIPKVVDFGISKLVDGATQTPSSIKLTADGTILGTPLYLAPEVAGGASQLDAQSDQYTFGVILYECLTGRRPFSASSLADLVGQILLGRFERPSALVEGMDPALEAVVLRAMRLQKGDRFRTMWSLGRALLPFASDRTRAALEEQFIHGESTQSQHPPPAREDASPAAAREDDPAMAATMSSGDDLADAVARAQRKPRSSTAVIVVAAAVAGTVAMAALSMNSRTSIQDSPSLAARASDAAIAQPADASAAPVSEDASAGLVEERDAQLDEDAAPASEDAQRTAVAPVIARRSARDAGRRSARTNHGGSDPSGGFIE